MNKISAIFVIVTCLFFSLQAEDWDFTRVGYTFENDADVRSDRGYTQGAHIDILMHRKDVNDTWFQIPFMSEYKREHFISFAAAQQIFTPENLESSDPIEGDRPYAGWLYAQMSLHQSSARHLDSLSLKAGIVGQHAYMEDVQKFIHWLIGSPEPQGWENQIGSKPGIQLDYQHKWRYVPDDFWGMEQDLIPYVSGEFGNVSIKASLGSLWRLGYNIPEDFGDSPIDEYGDNGVPAGAELAYRHKSKWSYYFDFGAGASFVLYDIFLDGTTLNGEQLVEKYYSRVFGSYGATLRYDDFKLSYIRTHYTKEYTTQKVHTNYGSLIFSYNF